MNLVARESPIGLDRLATPEEVRSAMSFWYRGTRNDGREVGSDFTGSRCNIAEDTVWLFIVSEKPGSMSN